MNGATWKDSKGWWYGERLINNRRNRLEFTATFMCHPDAEAAE
jgi:hypothetical protein